MKRLVFICLVGAASVGLLTACGKKEEAPPLAAAPAVPLVERPGSIAWNGKAFTLAGKPLKTARLWTFNGSVEGFSGPTSRIEPVAGGGLSMVVADATLVSPRGLNIQGADYPIVLVRLSRTAMGDVWDGALYYSTLPNGDHPAHSEAAEFLGKPIQGAYPKVGETTTLIYDMRKPVTGGDDWTKAMIDRIRIDVEDVPGGAFVIHQIAIAEPVDPALIPADAKAMRKAQKAAAEAPKS